MRYNMQHWSQAIFDCKLYSSIILKHSQLLGYGVFAKKTFLKGDFVVEYRGKIRTSAEADELIRLSNDQREYYFYHLRHNQMKIW